MPLFLAANVAGHPRICLISARLNLKNPLIIDAKGKNYAEFKHELNDILEKINRKKYDGVVIKNYVDSMEDEPQKSTQYIAFNPDQIIL
jgi:ATP-dependent RNA circularization protein (DNA/RNA ligase family)